jgi:hypothetical protein
MTSQTLEGNIEKSEIHQEEIKCQLRERGRSSKLLSYHPMTDVRLHMEEGKVVDGFHRSICLSIANGIMNWTSYLAFQLIMMMKGWKYN